MSAGKTALAALVVFPGLMLIILASVCSGLLVGIFRSFYLVFLLLAEYLGESWPMAKEVANGENERAMARVREINARFSK